MKSLLKKTLASLVLISFLVILFGLMWKIILAFLDILLLFVILVLVVLMAKLLEWSFLTLWGKK